MLQDMRDKACIVGLGQTKQGKLPGMSADAAQRFAELVGATTR